MEKKSANQFKVRTDLRAGATYPDMSGVCNSAAPQPGEPFPDMSGVCSGQQPPLTSTPTYPDRSGYCA